MTFEQILVNILGQYQPVTQEIEGVVSVVPGVAGVDWPFVLGGILMIVFVWSVLRIIGGVLTHVFS